MNYRRIYLENSNVFITMVTSDSETISFDVAFEKIVSIENYKFFICVFEIFLNIKSFSIKFFYLLFFNNKQKEKILISINSNPCIYKYIKPQARKSFAGIDVSDILSKGDSALNENKFDEALKYYQEANQKNPNENKVYRKMAKAQFNLKDYNSALKNYEIYLKNAPDDADCWIEFGETQRNSGFYQKAVESFKKALEIEPKNDLANRNILETKNYILGIYYPEQAKIQKAQYAAKNLKAALDMTVEYMTPEYMKDLQDVKVVFGETASMSGTSNIAQYENSKNTITVSNSYIYAAPQVIAAYLSHESVHAKDKDGYTSIYEEQDAYEVAAKFWIQNSNGINDPEMDYAADLYKQSPSSLKDRVEEIYTMRDSSIAKTSPNHPPDKHFYFNKQKKNAASQSLKQYDIIA